MWKIAKLGEICNIRKYETGKYSTHPLIRASKGLSFLFELANVRIIENSEKTKNLDHNLMFYIHTAYI